MHLVLPKRIREDQDVVEVCGAEVIKEWAEDVIDESLEIGRGVGESKGHDQGFEKAGRQSSALPPLRE